MLTSEHVQRMMSDDAFSLPVKDSFILSTKCLISIAEDHLCLDFSFLFPLPTWSCEVTSLR